MPTIEVNQKVLDNLAGKKVSQKDLEKCKAEIDEEKDGVMKIELGDTNRPDLWSVEGIARCIREKGLPKLKIKKSSNKIIVDKSIEKIRPFIAGVIAKNINIDEELLVEIIQLQEKLCENFGKKREKISIGVYKLDNIEFPVHYKAVDPKKIKFAPLNHEEEMDLDQILKKHPKGIEYGHIINKNNVYPIFLDSKEDVLSFPPIINSNYIGNVSTDTKNIFIEVTGTDIKQTILVLNIFAYALQDRSASLESVQIEYPYKTKYGKSMTTPYNFNDSISFDKRLVKKIFGLDLKDIEIKYLLESMQYYASVSGNIVKVSIPSYRNDIMHAVDVVEDIGIAYGYQNIKPLDIKSHTAGSLHYSTNYTNKIRNLCIGLGFQEVLSPILTDKNSMVKKMETQQNIIELSNPMNENYSAVRSWILPSLLSFLSKNLHREFPQKIFETGECVSSDTKTSYSLSACISSSMSSYEDISSNLSSLLKNIGIEYELIVSNDPSFIKGRCAEIIHNKQKIGVVGEVHPKVLNNWKIEKPVSAFELNISKLM